MAEFFTGLVFDGIWPALYALFIYMPQIATMLAVVSLLDNSGFTLGLGCTTLAVSSLDPKLPTSELKRNVRFTTFIPCSTKFPVLLFLCSVLLGWTVFSVFFLYVLSIALGLFFGGFAILQMPRFRKITFKSYCTLVIKNIWEFARRVTVGIVIASSVLYILEHFKILLPMTRILEPLFIPIGLGSASLIACLIFGLVSKEMIIGAVLTFGVMNLGLTFASSISFVLFVLLYTPCIPALHAMRAKIGMKHTLKAASFNFVVAYIVSFVAYTFLIVIQ